MSNKQLGILFCSIAISFIVGLGVMSFMPLYVTSGLGVANSYTGLFFATAFLATTLGTLSSGWLAGKFQRRKLLILISSLVSIPSFFLMGLASNIWQFVIVVCIAWFAFGLGTTMIRVIAGILADESERGRVFGVIGAATPLGALVGGAISGPIVDRWGIPTLFILLSSGFIVQFVIVLFLDEVRVEPSHQEDEKTAISGNAVGLGLAFWLLTVASLMGFIAISFPMVGRPLIMDQLGFDGTAISGVLVVGGFISLPLTFGIGWLSDKVGRKNLILLCYIAGALGMSILVFSEPLWHFWLSEIFLTFVGISMVVGSALITDLVPKEVLDVAISRYASAFSVGTIIGFILVGYIVDWVGLNQMFWAGAAFMLMALVIVLPVRESKRIPTITS